MNRRAFTLVELLVSVGVVAILSTVVVFVVNPAEALREGRDSARLSDIKTIDGMVSAYQQAVGGSLGTVGVTYISIPDPTATSSAGTDCAGLGAPFVGGGAFHCAASSTLRKVDGTGWIPVNLAAAPDGLSIGALPIDPINTTSSNQYYEYQTDGITYEIKALPESQTDMATKATSFTRGSNLALIVGTYLSQFGSSGTGNGQFSFATGIAFDSSGNVYVLDTSGESLPPNRVQKFDSSGNYISQFSIPSANDDEDGLVIDPSGNFYVSDSGNLLIKKFGSAGNYLSQFSVSNFCGGVSYPEQLAVDSSGNVYVADGYCQVQKFNASGTFLASFGSSTRGGGEGEPNGELDNPTGVALDASGNVYVADSAYVTKFDSSGDFISRFGGVGSGNGQFEYPKSITLDASGNIYVTDSGVNNRVQKFDASGNYLSQFGSSGSGNGQFTNPIGIGVNGNIYVVDLGDKRVEKFTSGN
jgi:prepilin-type N-terminal cleavage/methylation domain-containing protein